MDFNSSRFKQYQTYKLEGFENNFKLEVTNLHPGSTPTNPVSLSRKYFSNYERDTHPSLLT